MTEKVLEFEHAGFLVRLAARIIDELITSLAPLLFFAALFGLTQNPVFIVITLLWLAFISNFYYIYFHHKTGQTIGKKLLAIKVIKTNGKSLSWGDAIVRWIGYVISVVPLYLGLIWIAIDDKKQGWHDKIANTYVVRAVK